MTRRFRAGLYRGVPARSHHTLRAPKNQAGAACVVLVWALCAWCVHSRPCCWGGQGGPDQEQLAAAGAHGCVGVSTCDCGSMTWDLSRRWNSYAGRLGSATHCCASPPSFLVTPDMSSCLQTRAPWQSWQQVADALQHV